MSRTVHIENEIALRATPERVFRALTMEQHRWYPHSYGGARMRSVVFEPKVGGACFEDWGDGAGHLYGHVWHYDPPSAVTIRGYLQPAVNLEHVYTIEGSADGCILRQSMVAFGDISEEAAVQIRHHGDLTKVEGHLRTWVEEDVALRA